MKRQKRASGRARVQRANSTGREGSSAQIREFKASKRANEATTIPQISFAEVATVVAELIKRKPNLVNITRGK